MIKTKSFTAPEDMDDWVNAMGEQHKNVFATQTSIGHFNGLPVSYTATVFWRE